MTARTLAPWLVRAAATAAVSALFLGGLSSTRERFSLQPPHLVVTPHAHGVVDVRAEGAALAMTTVAARRGSVTVDRCRRAWSHGLCAGGAVRVRPGSVGPLARGETAHLRLLGGASAYTFGGSAG
jgi:hypothetical protein